MSAAGTFNTQEVRLWNNPQAQTSKTINFPKTYVAPPQIAVGINALDVQAGAIGRAKLYADNIDTHKCTIHADTWADTTLYMAGADYLIRKPGDLDVQVGEYNTEWDHPVERPQEKTSCRINFPYPFTTAPKVLVFFKTIDAGRGSSTRVKTYTSNIDAKGFTIHIDTWADTTLFRAIAGWVAYPEDKEHIFGGTANTMDVRPWDRPQEKQQRDVRFDSVSFWKKPSVFVALNWLDISSATNLRVKAYVDNITEGGLTWHIDSWADTKLWSAGISYIAFN
jgi:hypothetical protein